MRKWFSRAKYLKYGSGSRKCTTGPAIFEKVKRLDSADVIATVGDKIVVEVQEQPHRSLFTCVSGGRCEENEAPLDAAKRGLLEETGYDVQEPHLDAGEKISVKLVSFDEFLELSQQPDFRDQELASYLLRAKFEPNFKEELRKTIFG